MAAGRAAARPRARRSRGAPGSSCGGSRPAPGSAQCPPGSRPIESGFLGGTGAGPGRLLGRRLRLGARCGGCGVRPRRAPSAGGRHHLTLTTVLLFATFPSKIPLPAPTMPRALKGPRRPRAGGGGSGRRKGPRASPALPQSRCPRRPCAGAAPWASPPSPRKEGASPLGWGCREGRPPRPQRPPATGVSGCLVGAHRRVHSQRPAGLQGENTGRCPNFPFKSPHSDARCHH